MRCNLFVLVDNLNIKSVCQIHSFVILTCFQINTFQFYNYYLITTFFSLKTMFLFLKFWEVFCFWFLNPINSYKSSVFIKIKFVPERNRFACFCITPVGTCSSPCIKLYILCSCLYFCTIHISFASLQYSPLQYIVGTMIRFLVPFHVHIFCLAFSVCNHF